MPDLQRRVQRLLVELVESAGGRFDSKQGIPVGHLPVVIELFRDWARQHGERSGGGVHFTGRPGLWHALDELYPLQDPNRWNALRRAAIQELVRSGWQRRGSVNGSSFDIPDIAQR